jgi:hypothetical protein
MPSSPANDKMSIPFVAHDWHRRKKLACFWVHGLKRLFLLGVVVVVGTPYLIVAFILSTDLDPVGFYFLISLTG